MIPFELEELARSFSLVPATSDKKPRVGWAQWQNRKQNSEEQASLPHGSLWAIVTGSLYDLVVIDFDGPEGMAVLRDLGWQPNVTTPSGGAHVWVAAPDYPVKTVAGVRPGVDVRGEGGLEYVFGERKGGRYELLSTVRLPGTDVPADLLPERNALAGVDVDLGEWTGAGLGVPGAVRVVRKKARDVVDAAPGTSNAEFNRAVVAVAGLVAAGQVDGEFARAEMMAAAEQRGVGDVERVFASAWAAGAVAPWTVAEEGGEWVDVYDIQHGKKDPTPSFSDFPIEALPRAVRDLVVAGAPVLSAPPQFIAAATLPVLATGIGSLVTLGLRSTWHIPPSLYLGLVGGPSTSKSPAVSLALDPLAKAAEDVWSQDGDARLIVEDVTTEKLAELMAANERGLLFHSDELKSFFAGMGQYKEGAGGSDRAFYLKAWNGKSMSQDRIKRGSIIIPKVNLNVLGGIQPDVFDRLSYGDRDGMLERFLLTYSEPIPIVWSDDEIPDDVITNYRELWNRLRDNGREERVVPVSAEAKRAWKVWHDDFYAKPVADHLAFVQGKVKTHVARLALVLAECDGGGVCDTGHVEAAVTLGQYFLDQLGLVFYMAESTTLDTQRWLKDRERLVSYIDTWKEEHGSMPTRSILLQRGPRPTRRARVLDEMLDELGLAL